MDKIISRRGLIRGAAALGIGAGIARMGGSLVGATCPQCGSPLSDLNYCNYCGSGVKNDPIILPNNDLFSWKSEISNHYELQTGRYVEGIASSERIDGDKEKVLQSGMNIMPFISNGFISWNGGNKPKDMIGVPIEVKNVYVNGVPGLHVKAQLFEDNELSDYVWKLLHSPQLLDNNERLAFAVVGSVDKRDGDIITKSTLKSVMITNSPINYDVYVKRS